MAFGVCTNKQTSTLYRSKMDYFAKFFFDIVDTQNDETCYVKHLLAPLYELFRPYCVPARGEVASAKPQSPCPCRRGPPVMGELP